MKTHTCEIDLFIDAFVLSTNVVLLYYKQTKCRGGITKRIDPLRESAKIGCSVKGNFFKCALTLCYQLVTARLFFTLKKVERI